MQGTFQILLILSIIIVALFLVITLYAYMPANIADSAKSGFFAFTGYLGTKLRDLWTLVKDHQTIAVLSVVTIIYFAVSMYFIYKKPKTFGKYSQVSNIIIMLALFGLLLAIMLELLKAFRETPYVSTGGPPKRSKDIIRFQLSTIFKYIVLVVVLFALLVGVTHLVAKYKVPSEIFTLTVLLAIICLIVYGLYAYVYDPIKENKKVQTFFRTIQNLLLKIGGLITGTAFAGKHQMLSTPRYVYLILLAELSLIGAYFLVPYIRYKFLTHRGKLLMGEPMYTTKMKTLATYAELDKHRKNKEEVSIPDIAVETLAPPFDVVPPISLATKNSMNYDYHYTVSFWFFPDEQPPSRSSSSNKFTPIFDYGKKPIVLFNPSTSKLQVRMRQGIDGVQVLYSKKIKLQRWNNIVVTYDRGTLDLFINGKLVATKGNVVPYMQYDSIVVGYHKDLEENGVNGGISNVMYYPDILPLSTIQYNYRHFKNDPRV